MQRGKMDGRWEAPSRPQHARVHRTALALLVLIVVCAAPLARALTAQASFPAGVQGTPFMPVNAADTIVKGTFYNPVTVCGTSFSGYN